LPLTCTIKLSKNNFIWTRLSSLGGVAVWLSHEHAKFLSGRFIACKWNVDELLESKDEITNGQQLKVTVVGPFGRKQFE